MYFFVAITNNIFMNAWWIIIGLLILLLYFPFSIKIYADVNLLKNKANFIAKVFVISLVDIEISLDYGANVISKNKKGKVSKISLLSNSALIDYANMALYFIIKKMKTKYISAEFWFGSEGNAASVGIICGLANILFNTFLAINYQKGAKKCFEVTPIYTEDKIYAKLNIKSSVKIISILIAIIKTLYSKILKNKKAVSNNAKN